MRFRTRLLALLALVVLLLLARQDARATDLSAMAAADIRALQERLRDAQCYAGAIDGAPSGATAEALKRCPAMDPMLRIETGMHTARINRIGVDRACRLLATGSDDKTVRLWSLPEGKPVQTFRLPIGPGNDGKVYAVAVSPDGALVAAGGWDARWTNLQRHSVHLFDAASGALTARVGAFEEVISHLAFSPDGRHLAATLGATGLRVIDVRNLDGRCRGQGLRRQLWVWGGIRAGRAAVHGSR